MTDPFRIPTPFVVSFSGGRTSGVMLRRIIDAYDGTLPDDSQVVFCNTGKERPETLDFVHEVGQRWGVSIKWLEYVYQGKEKANRKNGKEYWKQRHTFRVTNYANAARNGEPFEDAIKARQYLPNVLARFCTVQCKIRTTQRYLKWLGWSQWNNAIGMRADEPHRVAKLRVSANIHSNEEPYTPLATAGVTMADVKSFWDAQPFRLQLQDHEGNCDLCFLKGDGKIRRIMRDRPDLAEWWVRMESLGLSKNPDGNVFRKDRPRYRIQLQMAQEPTLFDDYEPDELSIACHCTD